MLCSDRGDTADGAGRKEQASKSTLIDIKTIELTEPDTPSAQHWSKIVRDIENYRRQIIWLSLYSLVLLGIFIERAYCKSWPMTYIQ